MNDKNKCDRNNGFARKTKVRNKPVKPLSPAVKTLFFYILPAILASALISAAIWGGRQKAIAENFKAEAAKLKADEAGMFEEAFTELVSSVYNMHINLSKLFVAETPAAIADTLNEIQRESGLCAGLMGHIPQSHIDAAELNAFLIRIGDYAGCLSNTVMRSRPLCDGDLKQLADVYEASEKIYAELAYRLENNEFPKENITNAEFYFSNEENKPDSGSAGAEEIKKFPTLIYDGPFSESAEKSEPRGAAGKRLDGAEALLKARKYISDENAELTLASVSNGKIPSYDFEGKLTGGNAVDIGVSAQGGYLIFMQTAASGEIEGLPSEDEKYELAQKGKDRLAAIGYTDMKPVSYQYYSGSALISYAASQNGIVIYNDLIKVWIDRANGKITGIDARDYLFSHIKREFPKKILDIKEVRRLLSPKLSVKDTQLALIPLTPLTEKLCYEFSCSYGGAEYAVYLDAVTGEEIKILRIIKDEKGEYAI